MKTIILGVSGSISAYKAADLANTLRKRGYSVHVVMTDAATAFITPLTLQVMSKNPVHTNVMDEPNAQKIMHIDLVKEADAFLIAPASANIIGKIANGIGDDMLSTLALAMHDVPMFVAPAMNTHMYDNPAVRHNLELMKSYGYIEIEPRSALLACGDTGKGALAEITDICDEVDRALVG